MSSLSKIKSIKELLLILGICGSASAMELRPLAQFDFSTDVTIDKHVYSVTEENEQNSDPVFIIGTELLFSAEFTPIRYGFGLGFKSPQKNSDNSLTPAFLPIWGTFSYGAYHKDEWFAIPYAVIRAGTMAPLSVRGCWWERPFNFFFDAGIGALLPYDIGFEVNYGFSSVLKSFEHRETKLRYTSGRLGLQLSIGFELLHERKFTDK